MMMKQLLSKPKKMVSAERDHRFLLGMSDKEKALFFGEKFFVPEEENEEEEQHQHKQSQSRLLAILNPIATKIFDGNMIISENSQWKSFFDILVGLAIFYSCLTTMYFITFEEPETTGQVLEIFVDIVFILDIIFNFFQEYRDPETYDRVRDHKKIAQRYIRGWFALDLLAVIPFFLIDPSLRFTKLIRLIRLPKLFAAIDTSKFDQVLSGVLTNMNKDEKIFYMFILKNIYKIVRLILIALIITYFIGSFWYLLSDNINGETFITSNNLKSFSKPHQLLISCYFALTTLSTVGYGDIYPMNTEEQVFAIFTMIFGVTFFSYIMGNFNDVISKYDKKVGNSDMEGKLQLWIAAISRFNKVPIPADLVSDIYDFFEYYWKNDRLTTLQEDDPFLQAIPRSLYNNILEYLFADVFYACRFFFLPEPTEFRNRLAFKLLPRFFKPEEFLFIEGEDSQEVIFLMDGKVQAGFLNANEFVPTLEFERKGCLFGDYSIMYNKKTGYSVVALSKVKAFAIPRDDLSEILAEFPEQGDDLKARALRRHVKIMEQINVSKKEIVARGDFKGSNEGTMKSIVADAFIQAQGVGGPENYSSLLIHRAIEAKVKNIYQRLTEVKKRYVRMDNIINNIPDSVNSAIAGVVQSIANIDKSLEDESDQKLEVNR